MISFFFRLLNPLALLVLNPPVLKDESNGLCNACCLRYVTSAVEIESLDTFLQKQEANAACVSDRTAPFCVGIISLSSRDLKEQHRVLSNCRIQLAESNIQSGQHLLHALGSIQEAGISGEDLVLQHFFHLSLDEIKVLSARLKCNLSSEVITLPSVVNVFFAFKMTARKSLNWILFAGCSPMT